MLEKGQRHLQEVAQGNFVESGECLELNEIDAPLTRLTLRHKRLRLLKRLCDLQLSQSGAEAGFF